MAQSMETMKATFVKLMNENGFIPIGDKTHEGSTIYTREWRKLTKVAFYGEVEGSTIYTREWRKLTKVAFYGEVESSLRIVACEFSGFPLIRVFENSHLKDVRDYSSPKRAMNAIREIIRCAGYEF